MKTMIGTAGWTVPKQHLELFPSASEPQSHLQRYSSHLRCVEINSSFHRPHRRTTWERWAATVPADFRFAVKAPKQITHTLKLANAGAALLDFFNAVTGLAEKLGPVLVQLPPRLEFDEGTAREFFSTLRELHTGTVVLEPRHRSWFGGAVDQLLCGFEVARVAADPPAGSDLAARPGGWPGLRYWRFHGSPRTYYSAYEPARLQDIQAGVMAWQGQYPAEESWVIFDNTALGHATANAVALHDAMRSGPSPVESAR